MLAQLDQSLQAYALKFFKKEGLNYARSLGESPN
jgi:hypothetical protein